MARKKRSEKAREDRGGSLQSKHEAYQINNQKLGQLYDKYRSCSGKLEELLEQELRLRSKLSLITQQLNAKIATNEKLGREIVALREQSLEDKTQQYIDTLSSN